jgi:hypothetical protein
VLKGEESQMWPVAEEDHILRIRGHGGQYQQKIVSRIVGRVYDSQV